MWSFLPIRSLMDMQRAEAMRQAFEQARALQAEGYCVESDRVLDELAERMQCWGKGEA